MHIFKYNILVARWRSGCSAMFPHSEKVLGWNPAGALGLGLELDPGHLTGGYALLLLLVMG